MLRASYRHHRTTRQRTAVRHQTFKIGRTASSDRVVERVPDKLESWAKRPHSPPLRRPSATLSALRAAMSRRSQGE